MRGSENVTAVAEKPLVAWSHSSLALYRTCPRKYYEARVTKAWVEEFKGPAADWGKAVHKAFEQRLQYGSPLPSNMSQWEPLLRKLAGVTGRIYLEQQLALNRDLQVVDWFAKDVWVRTIVDYMCINEATGNAFLVDYKTGRRKDDDRQLALMAAVIFEKYPGIHKVIAAYVWLKDGASLGKATFTRPHKGKLWNAHLPTVECIENSILNGNWPEKPGGLCHGYCPVESCQFWHPRKEK